jgi:hypothetical protein
MAITFNVDKVVPGNVNVFKTVDESRLFSNTALFPKTKYTIESHGTNAVGPLLMSKGNAFIDALNTAYNSHLGIVLSPDDVWLLISQGVATHINMNAEALRTLFVSHEGKLVLEVNLDTFRRGQQNDWPGAFKILGDKIQAKVGPTKTNMLLGGFSTTGPVENAVSHLVLMSAMQSYFEYMGSTMCGFPKITLLGTQADWQLIFDKVNSLSTLFSGALDWWFKPLMDGLAHFVDAFEYKVDLNFWSNFYKLNNSSGGPYVRGWVVCLFPYVRHYNGQTVTNSEITKWTHTGDRFGGLTTASIYNSMVKVPFAWKYFNQLFSYEFMGGFVGSCIINNSIRPVQGWAVRQSEAELKFEMQGDKVVSKDPNIRFEDDSLYGVNK